jgi:hypothetical protein
MTPTTCSWRSSAATGPAARAGTSRAKGWTDLRRLTAALLCGIAIAGATPAQAGSGTDRIDDLQQELDSLIEDVEDLREPVGEFELFEECMYLIGVTQRGGSGDAGYVFRRGRVSRRGALAFDIRAARRAQFQVLAFPAEEPPSIECNEDAGEEDSDD